MNGPFLPPLLSRRVPVFYGWIVLGCLCVAVFARQGPAVATLSIFVEPLTREFGWSRTAGRDAADRAIGDIAGWLARRLAGDRRDDPPGRLCPDLAPLGA